MTDTLTDYSAVIRAEIEKEIKRLSEACGEPVRVEIGYMVNSHHGLPLFGRGDIVAGLLADISPYYPRSIRVRDKSQWTETPWKQVTW